MRANQENEQRIRKARATKIAIKRVLTLISKLDELQSFERMSQVDLHLPNIGSGVF